MMQQQKGFTLVETLLAVLILAGCVASLMQLTATGFFSVRYAKNEIIANNLMQESLEYIRNTRDTFLQEGSSWNLWLLKYIPCMSAQGCIVDPLTTSSQTGIQVFDECGANGCPLVSYFPDSGFYGYAGNIYPFDTSDGYPTIFKRTVTMTYGGPSHNFTDQLIVTVTVSWIDGSASKSTSQSMVLTNWAP